MRKAKINAISPFCKLLQFSLYLLKIWGNSETGSCLWKQLFLLVSYVFLAPDPFPEWQSFLENGLEAPKRGDNENVFCFSHFYFPLHSILQFSSARVPENSTSSSCGYYQRTLLVSTHICCPLTAAGPVCVWALAFHSCLQYNGYKICSEHWCQATDTDLLRLPLCLHEC